jgi:uncharacterized membrane protein YobD (UPF0266 family)
MQTLSAVYSDVNFYMPVYCRQLITVFTMQLMRKPVCLSVRMLRVIQVLLSNTSYSITKIGRNTLHYLNDIYELSFFYNNLYCVSNSLLRKRGFCHTRIWQKFDKIWDKVSYTVSKPTKHRTRHLISPVTWIWQHCSVRFFPFSLFYVTFCSMVV